ncbi:MAG TPA: DUF2269 family protein [Ignavibacteriaceae bacterium]|nr:DUF2269 family protein [Ignavibacteriaceae bacterium]
MVYLIWKLLHVIAVIIFLGNITITPFWKGAADRSKDRIKIADTLKNIIRADRIFTMPSVTFLIIFGFGAQMTWGYPIETPWIMWSLILIIISAAAFMAKVVPLQKKMFTLANDENKFKWDEYEKLSRQWNLWGTIATLAPYIAVIFMVLKPAF